MGLWAARPDPPCPAEAMGWVRGSGRRAGSGWAAPSSGRSRREGRSQADGNMHNTHKDVSDLTRRQPFRVGMLWAPAGVNGFPRLTILGGPRPPLWGFSPVGAAFIPPGRCRHNKTLISGRRFRKRQRIRVVLKKENRWSVFS